MHLFLKKHKLLVLFFLVGVLLILNLSSQTIRGTFSSLLSPTQSLLWKAGTSTVEIFSKVSQERAQELETENLLFRQELLLIHEMVKENARLREVLDIAPREKFDLLFTEIIGKEVERDVLFLNKGTAEGVMQGSCGKYW